MECIYIYKFLIIICFSILLIYWINKYFLKSVKLICLRTVGKEENKYVKEFIHHYKQLGFNHIYIYDNNEVFGEKFEEEIKEEIKNGFVSIINYRGYKGIQLNAFYDCYQKNYKRYKWLAFFDFDEFLELAPNYTTIQQFLDNKIFYNCQNIKINWLMFTDNDLIKYENKPLKERFTTPLYNDSLVIKSIVRGNLNLNYWEKATNPHTSKIGFYSCSSSGKNISSTSFMIDIPEYNFAFLKHYHTKTIEEYIIKLNKGYADHVDYPGDWKKVRIKNFFDINKKTKEKLDYFKKYLNYSFNDSS